jgi:hypothetical protein
MKKSFVKVVAVLLAYLGVMLSASSGLGQSIVARHRGLRSGSPGLFQVPSSTGELTDGPLSSPQYTFTIIDFPGQLYTNGNGANSAGQIVGSYGPLVSKGDLGNHGFLLTMSRHKKSISETFSTIDFPKVTNQSSDGINDQGQIVGEYIDGKNVFHGYELNKGKFTTLDVPFSGAAGTAAIGINNSGDIVGGWIVSSGFSHGFELSSGTYTQLDYPGSIQTFANRINNNGDIVGYFDDSTATHGFLLSGTTYTSIDVPGATATFTVGINDAGDIVGLYCTTSQCVLDFTGSHGFLLKGGTLTNIDFPGATSSGAANIDNKGQIVGVYRDCGGLIHTFRATPK